jgi:hypothetical protein
VRDLFVFAPSAARTEAGAAVRATRREGNFVIHPSAEGESLIQSPSDARKTLEKRLRRAGKSEAEVRKTLKLVDSAEAGVPVRVAPDLTVIHGAVDHFDLAFEGRSVSEAFPALVAFHTLALALGSTVYSETLNGLRNAIRAGEPYGEWHSTERLLSSQREYRPSHLIGLSEGEPHIVIQIRLFWMLVWRVHFHRAATSAEPQALVLDLVNRNVHAA